MKDGFVYGVGLVLTLGFAGLISAIETALVSLSSTQIHDAMDRKRWGARFLSTWLQQPGRVLATLYLMRCGFLVGAGLVAWQGVQILGWPLPMGGVAAAVAVLALMLGHMVPQALAKRHPLRLALASMVWVHGGSVLVFPVVGPLSALVRRLARWVGAPLTSAGPFWTLEEIRQVIHEADTQGLGERSKDLLATLIEFSDTIIREVMVPRTAMVAISVHSDRAAVQEVVLEAGHSRIPVYNDTIDNIIGILHVKDLFVDHVRHEIRAPSGHFALKAMLRPTFYVPEIMKISKLLREFQRRKTHMAIVVDEYGGTAGVITLEDIIEEIVGDIQDEYDVDEKQFRILGENKIIADARVNIWDLEKTLGMKFPNDAEYETLAGFLMSRIGSLPKVGTVSTWNNLTFTIKEANEKRIGMVEIERRETPGVR